MFTVLLNMHDSIDFFQCQYLPKDEYADNTEFYLFNSLCMYSYASKYFFQFKELKSSIPRNGVKNKCRTFFKKKQNILWIKTFQMRDEVIQVFNFRGKRPNRDGRALEEKNWEDDNQTG